MVAALVVVFVLLVLMGIRLLNRRTYQSQLGVYARTARGRQSEAIQHRRGLEAREALETLFAPEGTVANSTVPRPLGIVFGEPVTGGVEVISVVERSPAGRAGVPAGAILTSIAGEPTGDAAAAERAVGRQVPGLGVRLTWSVAGEPRSAEVIL